MSTSKKLAALALTSLALAPLTAFAQEAGHQSNPVAGLSAAIAIGMAALGGTLAQGRAASTALEGISRNPGAAGKIMTPMILGLALIESLVLFALVIAYFLQAKA